MKFREMFEYVAIPALVLFSLATGQGILSLMPTWYAELPKVVRVLSNCGVTL